MDTFTKNLVFTDHKLYPKLPKLHKLGNIVFPKLFLKRLQLKYDGQQMIVKNINCIRTS